MSQFVTREQNGVNIHVLPTTKYKVTSVVVSIHRPLQTETVTPTALIPYVLMRGSEHYPNSQIMMGALDDLYGASLHGYVSKRGERQLVEFSLQVTNERFLSSDAPILANGIRLMADVILRPKKSGDAFDADAVEKEKDLHAKRIDSLMDDKIAYAAERCLQEMCKDERYGIPKLGYTADLKEVTSERLFGVYDELIRTAPIHVFVVGHVDPEEVFELMKSEFAPQRGPITTPPSTEVRHSVGEVKEIVERMDINQGKLNIGFRTGVSHADEAYPAMIVYNAILGGFPHSKLFVNVREKASLAYYASSRLESLKGLLYVQSGIQVDQFEKALAIIREQIEDMRKGQISETEMTWTKSGLINQYRQVQDSATSAIDPFTNGLISGRTRSWDEMIDLVSRVTLEDVVAVAQKVTMDTVYFLRDKEAAANA